MLFSVFSLNHFLCYLCRLLLCPWLILIFNLTPTEATSVKELTPWIVWPVGISMENLFDC